MGKNKRKQEHQYLSSDFCNLTSTIDKPSVRPGINIPEELILDIDTDSGLFMGLESPNGKGYFVGKSSNCDGNAIAIGVNGSGKSRYIAKSTIETWRDPFVVLDIKGELAARYMHLKKKGVVNRSYIVFDPGNYCGCYDVYGLLHRDDPHFVQYVKEISNAIVPMPPDVREPYWINMARDTSSAAIIFYHSQGFDFIETMIAIQTVSISELCRQIKSQGCDLSKMFVSEIGSLKPEQQSSIGTELKRHTLVFATDAYIQAAFSRDDDNGKVPFLWDDVVNADDPVNIFLCIDQDKLEQWSVVMRLMLTQLIRALERRPDKHSPQGHRYPPIMILLDEFPLLGTMDIITSALTTLRSKKVTFLLMIQSLTQLDSVYGSNARRIIIDNCQYKIFLIITEPDSQEYFSRLIGTIPSGQRGISENYDPDTQRSTFGRQLQESRSPLIYPHEFVTNQDIWLHTPYGFLSTIKLPASKTRLHVIDFERLLMSYRR